MKVGNIYMELTHATADAHPAHCALLFWTNFMQMTQRQPDRSCEDVIDSFMTAVTP